MHWRVVRESGQRRDEDGKKTLWCGQARRFEGKMEKRRDPYIRE